MSSWADSVFVARQTSSATTLTYLTSQVFFLGSHYGDSHLLCINPSPVSALTLDTLPISPDIATITPSKLTMSVTSGNDKGKGRAIDVSEDASRKKNKEGRGVIVLGKGSYLSTLQTFKNLAPIMDAAFVDTDGSGQVSFVLKSACLGIC